MRATASELSKHPNRYVVTCQPASSLSLGVENKDQPLTPSAAQNITRSECIHLELEYSVIARIMAGVTGRFPSCRMALDTSEPAAAEPPDFGAELRAHALQSCGC